VVWSLVVLAMLRLVLAIASVVAFEDHVRVSALLAHHSIVSGVQQLSPIIIRHATDMLR